MYVISAFDHSVKLEMAIVEIEKLGVARDKILITPLARKATKTPYFDPYRSDGFNVFAITAVGSLLMLIGVIYGYVLPGGPILWGFGAFILGCLLTFLLDYYVLRRRGEKIKHPNLQVIVQIRCQEQQLEKVENILWSYQTLGMAILKR